GGGQAQTLTLLLFDFLLGAGYSCSSFRSLSPFSFLPQLSLLLQIKGRQHLEPFIAATATHPLPTPPQSSHSNFPTHSLSHCRTHTHTHTHTISLCFSVSHEYQQDISL